ncbi:MAG: cell division protein FtsQ/DivIB [Rubrivivax sp.]
MAATLAAALPADVRLMNAVSAGVWLLAGGVLAAAGVLWLLRAPWLPIRGIELEGELTRASAPAVRAVALPRLSGNLLGLDLQQARSAFESVPWVRRAVVRRVWPDRLAVRLEEHRAVALWEGDSAVERLVNSHGEVFEANIGEIEDEGLPVLAGPPGSSQRLLAMRERLRAVLEPLGRDIERLQLSGRGSWSARLDNDAEIELGRGTDEEVLARAERFVRTIPQVARHYGGPFVRADLRHPEGYAVRIRGMTTAAAPGAARKN